MNLFSNNKISKNSGFTLIEMMVTVGIFVFMTSLFLAGYSNYNRETLLANAAYDMALTIRIAQTYGISVKSVNEGAATSFGAAYGIHFEANSGYYTLFADADNNNTYNTNNDGKIQRYSFKQGYVIPSDGICVDNYNGGSDCDTMPSSKDVGTLDIIFRRPDPEAIICGANSCSANDPDILSNYARITIRSVDGNEKYVKVLSNGQISVAQ